MITRFETSSAIIKENKSAILKDWYRETLSRLWYLNKNIFHRQGAVTHCIDSTLSTLSNLLARPAEESAPQPLQTGKKETKIHLPSSYFSCMDEVADQWKLTELSLEDTRITLEILEANTQKILVTKGGEPDSIICLEAGFLRLRNQLAYDKIVSLEQSLSALRDERLTIQTMSGRFLANSSHDMKTPLTAILGFSELLLEESYGAITEEQRLHLGHIENSAHNLLEIVNNFLDLMHIRSGKLKLEMRQVDITAILKNIHQILTPLSVRRKVTFIFEPPENLGVIEADEGVVRHIVYYLLSSALRATPTGGTVTISAYRKDPNLIIQTHDTALHLPPEALANMEIAYPLLENSPARGYEGWEVGLPLVKRYVGLHGGSLELESLPESGTIFRISLPTYHTQKDSKEAS